MQYTGGKKCIQILNDYKFTDYNFLDNLDWEHGLFFECNFSNVGAGNCDGHFTMKVLHRLKRPAYLSLQLWNLLMTASRTVLVNILNSSICLKLNSNSRDCKSRVCVCGGAVLKVTRILWRLRYLRFRAFSNICG